MSIMARARGGLLTGWSDEMRETLKIDLWDDIPLTDAEIEAVLQEHPAVADVGVFGIPDEEWGEQVKAAVELQPGYEASPELETALRDFAREHLAGYKVPRSVDFERELPRTAAGKLYVRRLRDRYWKEQERRI